MFRKLIVRVGEPSVNEMRYHMGPDSALGVMKCSPIRQEAEHDTFDKKFKGCCQGKIANGPILGRLRKKRDGISVWVRERW